MGKYISTHTGLEIDAAVDAVAEVAEKVENQTQATIDASIAYTQGQQAIKKYVALLTQSGTNDPVATILENTLGTITFQRLVGGVYFVNGTNLFTINKTIILPPVGRIINQITWLVTTFRISDNQLGINATKGGGQSDDTLSNYQLEIRVYP